ncbi:endo-beta-N-acetylglucosaminidase [Arcanobacterium ihumii]|uniref:endo-beta-N-acetylglucosaminidase n=1 Tax=Arcanobacterium ihumii TaxID=2138162 RepID=UPI000F51CC37|nr:putative Ig domain-containing protein [Arcanobacterium ihumii]
MRSTRRRISFISALSIFAFLASPAQAADSYPPAGEAAVASAQPVLSGYRVQSIRDWTPESDPFANQLRATVPLQKRIAANPATQAKPELDGRAEVMLMQGDYGNSFFGSTTYNNTFSDHTFNFWQYSDYWSPWHGAASLGVPQTIYNPATSNWRDRGFEFGVLSVPSPEYTNAAHRNGVKSIGILYFDPYFRPGLTFKEMFDKDPNSQGYLLAQKLVEMAKYYGFDGYFLNQEEAVSDPSEFKPFMAYLTSQGLYTQWYDTNSQFNASKAAWLRDNQHGRIHSSVFVNYGNDGKAMNAWAKANGYDPYAEVFAGVEANQTGFGGTGGVDQGFTSATNHSPLTSIALFTPSDFYQRGLDDQIKDITGRSDTNLPFMQQDSYQWMVSERERMYFSGPKQDVTATGAANLITREEVGINNTGWIGVADFIPARSVISGTEFYSLFNTGKGMRSYQKGTVSSAKKFSDMGAQSILPSWQWWITAEKQPTLKADFDYGDQPRTDLQGKPVTSPFTPVGAYDGGSSLVLYGVADVPQTVKLFKTDLKVTAGSKASVVWKNTQATANAQLAVVFADEPTKTITFPLGDSTGQWQESVIDLGQYGGKTIVTLGVQVENAARGVEPIQVNVGKLALTSGQEAPQAPQGLHVDELLTDGQMNISWQPQSFNEVDSYVFEGIDSQGNVHEFGRGFGQARYIKNVGISGDFTLQVRAVGKDGQYSAPAKLVVEQSKLPQNLTIPTALDSQGHFVEAKEAGKVSLAWNAVSGAQGYEVRLKTLFADANNPYHGEAKVQVGAGQTDVTMVAPPEGERFQICVTPLGKELGAVKEVCQRGRYHDSYAAPMHKQDFGLLGGAKFHLKNPTTTDWQKVSSKGDETWVATRGKNNNAQWNNHDENGRLTVERTVKSTIAYSLVDYAGNSSQPIELKLNGDKIDFVDRAAPEVWATPWNPQVVKKGQAITPITVTARDNAGGVKISVSLKEIPQSTGAEAKPIAQTLPTTRDLELVQIKPSTQLQAMNSAQGDMAVFRTASLIAPQLAYKPASASTQATSSLGGLSFDEATRTLSGVPQWEGVRELVVTATDKSGNSSTMSLTIQGSGTSSPTPSPAPDSSASQGTGATSSAGNAQAGSGSDVAPAPRLDSELSQTGSKLVIWLTLVLALCLCVGVGFTMCSKKHR